LCAVTDGGKPTPFNIINSMSQEVRKGHTYLEDLPAKKNSCITKIDYSFSLILIVLALCCLYLSLEILMMKGEIRKLQEQSVSWGTVTSGKQCEVEDNGQLLLTTSSNQSNYTEAPLTIIMDYFVISEKIKNKEEWQSEPFFAFQKGYLVYLSVYPAGLGDAEGNYISVFVHLMKGPYDDELEQSGYWPMRGTFTVKLLWFYFTNYKPHSYNISSDYSLCEWCTFRVRQGNKALISWGIPNYLSHKTYYQHPFSLHFNISYSNHQADIDAKKLWQRRQQSIISYLISYLICVLASVMMIYAGKLAAFRNVKFSFKFTVAMKSLTITMLAMVSMMVADVLVITMSDYMDINDSVSGPIHCMLLRLYLVSQCLLIGNIVKFTARVWQGQHELRRKSGGILHYV